MKRREFITLLGGVAAAWPLAAGAQQPIPVIGFIHVSSMEGYPDYMGGFRLGLKENGYIEGENVAIEYRWADNDLTRLPVQAADLIRRRVNVITASSAPAAVLVVKATTIIPIVFLVPEDPVRLGLVTSLSRPGGNATGVNFFSAELAAKRLELLRALVPTVTRVAVLLNPAEPTIAAANRRDVEAAVESMGLQIRIVNASTVDEIYAAFATLDKQRPDALFISSGPFFTTRRILLAHLSTRHSIPAIHGSRAYPEAGGLMSYGTNLHDAYRQAGVYVGRILKGAKPADLPVVQSTKFELVINANAARILGLTIPPSLLALADEVIE